MNTPLPPEKSGIRPFENDVEYLMSELEWVRVRTRRIQAQNERQGSRNNPARASIAARHLMPVMACGEQVACLLKEEHDMRSLIDFRLKVGDDEGKVPSLVRLCRDHGLNDFEKHILLLGMVACLGTTAGISTCSGWSLFIHRVSSIRRLSSSFWRWVTRSASMSCRSCWPRAFFDGKALS